MTQAKPGINTHIGVTLISGFVCNECGNTLPPHTIETHLDPDDNIHKCPHPNTIYGAYHPLAALPSDTNGKSKGQAGYYYAAPGHVDSFGKNKSNGYIPGTNGENL